jgi:CheY-like chemotaxis protein
MQSEQKKILVVDDEPDILAFLQALLEQEGYTVATTDKTVWWSKGMGQLHHRAPGLMPGKEG